MKHHSSLFSKLWAYVATTILTFGTISQFANAAAVNSPVDLATIPLANSPTVPIQSNLLFIFDDSGSMADDSMPDASNSTDIRLFRNGSYNTIFYNPAFTYLPPVNFNAGGIDSAKYPSQTGLTTASGASTATKPNWRAVKNDAYGKVATGTADITNNAIYSTTLPGNAVIPAEYCTKADLKVCATQTGPTALRPFFAPIRWCNSTANALAANPAANTCQAANVTTSLPATTFNRLRTANARLAVITISSGGSSRIVNSVRISGAEIMFAPTTTNTNNTATIATEIANRINQCANVIAGNCGVSGYAASANGASVFIFAPANSLTTALPVLTRIGGSSGETIAPFARAGNPTIAGTNNAPGQVVLTVITASPAPAVQPVFNFPGTNAKAPTRADCLGASCTYVEEMTNYANWYTYYRTRAQMMKTATSLAFRDIGDDFRVGFMTTSTQAPRSLNIARFDNAQKALWFDKLFSTVSDQSTPLRGALSKAGRIYANKTTAGGVFTDPVQYECQQNFTLLTTDGFWNTGGETTALAGPPLNVDGTANVGDRDAGTSVPLGMRQGTPPVANTLADVAKYYRDTDLRTPALNNCGAGVCSTPSVTNPPPNEKQVMVTFTMGLGADGTLSYVPNYDSVPGDFADIKGGTKDWPDPIANTGAQRIDDLWHAAVNGGGTYFSAKNPTDVVTQLKEALTLIRVKSGAGAAAATSTLNPVTGDNFAYVASYTSGLWAGNLERRTVSVTTGEVSRAATHCVEDVVPTDSCASPSTIVPNPAGGYYCKAPAIPDAASCEVAGVLVADCTKIDASCAGSLKLKVGEFTSTARNIKMNSGGSLTDFRYSNLNGTQKTYFDTAWLAANLTQWTTLTTNQKANATGTNLVNYLRGESGYTLTANTPDNRVFRSRRAVLGDLIDSKPTFVGAPPFGYSDPGYQTYKTAQAGRAKTVYVGSNDGMLHAFNADTLEERWAYVPSMVIPNMWKLADSNYSAKHAFYVDGDVIVSDVCTASCTTASATWKTILIGGLNAGGRGYYALDVTDPANPLFLWEFNASSTGGDVNMGYSFGNPIITKRSSDDKWVVIFTSGYNNIPDNNSFYSLSTTNFKPNNPALFTGGDGRGYLFVIDAATGNKLNTIPTNVGSTTVPSGLGDIKALRPDFQKNNTTQYVYGGDLLGNVWRFNLDTNVAFNFAQLQAGVAQPVTTSPELGIVKDKTVVIVGTGKYLEVSDLTNTDQQTLYAMKDDNAVTTLTNPRGSLAQQTIVPAGSDFRQSGSPNANSQPLVTGNGWYIDFPDSRERQNVASELVLGTLLVPTTVPESSACQPAGYGWFNYLDYRTGLAIRGNNANNIVAQRTTSPSVGFNVVYIDGKPKVSNVVADDENPKLLPDVPFDPSGTGFQLRRSIWREIETK